MRFEHPDHPGRSVRLAYCLNLHPAEDLDGVLEGMRTITLPLRDRLGVSGGLFGVGPWLPARVAMELTAGEGSPDLDRFAEFFAENGLDPFTYNAFPYGGFHERGLKEAVFRPTWAAAERLAFTVSVAQIAQCLHEVCGGGRDAGHVSISTHSGGYKPELTDRHWDEITENFCRLQHLRTLLINGNILFILPEGLGDIPLRHKNQAMMCGSSISRRRKIRKNINEY